MKRNGKIILVLFALLVAAQWYVPGRMIFDSEQVIATGKKFKFTMAPVDPLDFFRGEYLRINFAASRVNVSCDEKYEHGDEVYVLLYEDDSGFVVNQSAGSQEPASENYVKAEVNWMRRDSDCSIFLNFPFNKYYMKEGTAYQAEDSIRKAVRDSSQIAYAEVVVKNGEAVITGIYLNGIPIEEVIRRSH